MITKGIITKINQNDNTCEVRIPLFETAGVPEQYITTATFSIEPGIYNSYIENDIVFVGFEDNSINSAVIVGKFFKTTNDEKARKVGAISCSDLQVANSVNLPIDTTIGNISAKDLANLNNKLNLLSDKIETKASIEVFSTDEKIIGTWVDGKALYRKVFIKTYSPAIAAGSPINENISLIDLNFDTIYQDISHTIQIGTKYSLNTYTVPNQSDYFNCYIDITNKKLFIRGVVPTNDSVLKHIITVEYTKK